MPDSTPPQRSEVSVLLASVIDMQKRVVGSIDRMATRMYELTGEAERSNRNQTQIRADLAGTRGEIATVRNEVSAARNEINGMRQEFTNRFEAVGARFEEIERGLDRLTREVQEARSEIVAQNMETLNAVQAGLDVKVQLGELAERVEALERRMRPE